MNNAAANMITDVKLIKAGFNENPPSPQTASIKIDKPAEAIRATMVGLKPDNTPCITANSLYLKYIHARIETIIQDGRIEPMVAIIAPGIPAILFPTKVAALIAIGPGVISAIVIRSVNSVNVIQWFKLTT